MIHYTTIEQSKHLLELGLDTNTADMLWEQHNKEEPYVTIKPWTTKGKNIGAHILPCWSLTALLELMPPYLFEWERGIDLNIYRNLNGKGWHVSYMPNNINDMKTDKFRQITNGDTPIEAAYNMMCWLLKEKYLKK